MSDPIKAALAAAHREASSFYTEADTARIIAAFLRAIPEGASIPTGQGDLRARIGPMPALAAAVERAAREAGDG